ncbi:hypothetical protein [Neolewinella agarilytica]|uniref:hypothetical protein n=1 Tax=Neolewinella agarilytica TaxID=478744 RepID=UPI0023521302|nr:hypothetical protein [Neolewinella agarilytica]
MHPVQKHLFDTNFRDLTGTKLEGTIALSDELINLGILDFLQQLQKTDTDAPEPQSSAPATSSSMPKPEELLKMLTIEEVKYRTEAGKTLLDIKAGIV